MKSEADRIVLLEAKIKNDVALKKLEKKLQKTQDELDYAEIEEQIKIEYPDGLDIVKDRKLIKDGVKKIIPLKCKDCEIIKVFPYDFTAINGRDYGTNRCKICTKDKNEPCKKYQEHNMITCECGIKYVGYENAIIKHKASKQHKNRMGDMILGFRYKQKELISLCQVFKVPYYKKLTKNEMIEQLRPLMINDITNIKGEIDNENYSYHCIKTDDKEHTITDTRIWYKYENEVRIETIFANALDV